MEIETEIIKGIVSALRAEYAKAQITSERMKQGFQAPCFFILFLSGDRKARLAKQYQSGYLFDIHYFPEGELPRRECAAIAESLYDLLELIPVGDGLLRGVNMHHEIVEDVLHFFVGYHVGLVKEKEKNVMGDLKKVVNRKQ